MLRYDFARLNDNEWPIFYEWSHRINVKNTGQILRNNAASPRIGHDIHKRLLWIICPINYNKYRFSVWQMLYCMTGTLYERRVRVWSFFFVPSENYNIISLSINLSLSLSLFISFSLFRLSPYTINEPISKVGMPRISLYLCVGSNITYISTYSKKSISEPL